MGLSYGRVIWVVAVLVAGLLLVVASAAGEGRRANTGRACTHGLSSIGPIVFRNGEVVGGDTTPDTETCLP
jgi:hypothetical protein